MFAYLRYFSLGSALVVLVAALALGLYFRSAATEDLSDLVTRNNQALVQGFTNNLWKNHAMVAMMQSFRDHKPPIPPQDWPRYKGYKEYSERFSRDVFRYFEGMPAVQVNIYAADGSRILALTQERILDPESGNTVRLEDAGPSIDARNRGLGGTVASQLLEGASFVLAGQGMKEGTLMQSVIPIMSDSFVPLVQDPNYSGSSNVQGVVEVFYDVSRQWDKVFLFQWLVTGAIMFIFLMLIGTLIVVAARAEAIITRQHETNLELAAQAASAEAENMNKSQFLANISHELRTPLNAIIGFSEMIKNETYGELPNQQYKDYIRDIHQSSVHLLSLINDILDYSKAEAGKLDLNLDETDVTKVILSSLRLVAPRAEQAQVELVEEVPKEHYVITTDAKKLKQVMLNLLSNAVKFTPAGGMVKVTMWANIADHSIAVEVKDSGIGIAQKDIARALAPFGQVDSALSRKYEGTGLGLPLTKKFVELMGGTFSLTSEENVGTTVLFTLPREMKQAA